MIFKMGKKSTPKNKIFLIFLVLTLTGANAFQFYTNWKNTEKYSEVIENNGLELVATFVKLDSISDQLDNKIIELENYGENIDSLVLVKEQLEEDKKILRSYKKLAKKRFEEIKNKVESYEFLLVQKDEEIVKLKEVNETLLTETISLKEERNKLNSEISNLSVQNNELGDKIAVASMLKAGNISFSTISSKGKTKIGQEFKSRNINKLTIGFNLEKNDLAEVGTKDIILRIIEPEWAALYNIAAGSGTFTQNGGKMFYTIHKEILFDNSEQELTLSFSKGSEFKKGLHHVEIYCQGTQIGKGSFIVK